MSNIWKHCTFVKNLRTKVRAKPMICKTCSTIPMKLSKIKTIETTMTFASKSGRDLNLDAPESLLELQNFYKYLTKILRSVSYSGPSILSQKSLIYRANL